jgi:septum site-determining protein MinD
MAATIITITSGKGGVGKTTTTANIAAALSLAGQRVIALDGDIGLRLMDVVEGRCTLTQALVRDPRAPALWLLPAAQTRDKSDITIDQMLGVCNTLRQYADYVLIDSPAGIEQGFQNSIAPADRVLIVTTPDVSALRDADKVIYLLERDWRKPPGLVLNRFHPRLAQRGEMRTIDDVLDILAIDLLGVVPEDEQLTLASDRGQLAVYNPRVASAQAYRNIAQRMMGNNVPLMRFKSGGVLSNLLGR